MLDAMIANPGCKQMQTAALSALLSLCSQDKDAQSDAPSWNASSVTLQCMKNHASAKDICGNACGLLWTLALDSQRRSNILTSGGITTTLGVMKTDLSSRPLQRKACGLLTALTCDGKGLDVMRAHKMQHKVVEDVINILSNLALYSEDDSITITTF
jgi:hypothetical protein